MTADHINGIRNTFFCLIKGIKNGAQLQEIVVVSDRKKPEKLFVVPREWVDLKTGLISFPSFQRVKDSDELYEFLVSKAILPETNSIPWKISGKNEKPLKLSWVTYCIYAIYQDFAKNEYTAALEWIDSNGSECGRITTEEKRQSTLPLRFSYDDVLKAPNQEKKNANNETTISKKQNLDDEEMTEAHVENLERVEADGIQDTDVNIDLNTAKTTVQSLFGTSQGAPSTSKMIESPLDVRSSTVDRTVYETVKNLDIRMTTMENSVKEILKGQDALVKAQKIILDLLNENLRGGSTFNQARDVHDISFNSSQSSIEPATELAYISTPATQAMLATPKHTKLKKELGLPLMTLEDVEELDKNLTENRDVKQKFREFLYLFDPSNRPNNSMILLDMILHSSIALVLNICFFEKTEIYTLYNEYVSTWKKILPIVGKDDGSHSQKDRIKTVVQRWLRSKRQTAKRKLFPPSNDNKHEEKKRNVDMANDKQKDPNGGDTADDSTTVNDMQITAQVSTSINLNGSADNLESTGDEKIDQAFQLVFGENK